MLGITLDEDEVLRADLLYKPIIRDFRKFYIVDFNLQTSYISKKQIKTSNYYLKCIKEYLLARFPELLTGDEFKDDSFKYDENFDNLIYFIGCLLYPKDFPNKEDINKESF